MECIAMPMDDILLNFIVVRKSHQLAQNRSDYHQGNIYQDDFWEVWQTKFQPYRDRSRMKKDECARCKYFRYCQGNGMHLRDNEGNLLVCHLNRLTDSSTKNSK